ncbi:endoribonuclease L-PSP [Dinoroseobacter shibae DFL 12 = DSM 16493]|jgi:enamine deaminase RidA (YjgF/YER057c/UK114 family)|uniref:Endoribonuclease L-PSP n=1 Tax=Dinoroseobacter shibae (strain DSM 16493 / NCIMB 14021 / DFL 12) TaxID=398580 RepID=A8LJA5_DINSH|nr:RidA family protein [Dinoroseobacter shibae]ABV93127.1 endoribonuclease L-PSP [Dinoroseobacter shibae DFL 12 = DSM 16493]URF48054.1 RidA family protein [Dinoroseobacter shibae]URF52364.1 RidA family protein [Dinoroseobacter shibae]
MLRPLSPDTIRPPFARYAHGVEVPAGARLVVCSGQLGIGPDDVAPDSAEAQAALCFANLDAVLAEGGMGRADVVRINAYVTDRTHMTGYMAARDAWLSAVPDHLPASTLMIVSGFTRPEFKVEIELIAAQMP